MYHYNYLIINQINGKFYIGKHSTNNLNDGYMGSGTAITAAIAKYGELNFKKYILLFCDSEAEAYAYEKILIKQWMIESPMCYNLTGGGSAGFGYKHTDETKQIISKLHKGKPLSEEHRKKLSEIHKGHKFSEEHNNKISEALKGRPKSEEHQQHLNKVRQTEEFRQKLSNSLQDKPKSEEHKQHLKDSWTDERKKQQSERCKGVPMNKYKWLSPDGEIHIMDIGNAHRYHPDWKLIEDNE